ncbi:hypothetical protein CKY47_22220 [Saccharothrix yanglingensis]|uniref:Uncharacterized protein n=1 Tax=Saccharothrix yanglingensis TaxID=659496 RepID=A0ABU0X3F4_9PSEU|nr:hypothetical protein [Saccharothrix yanglingensis]
MTCRRPSAPSVPTATTSAGLAATGANVSWPALGGLLTPVTGIGPVLRPRRRRTWSGDAHRAPDPPSGAPRIRHQVDGACTFGPDRAEQLLEAPG